MFSIILNFLKPLTGGLYIGPFNTIESIGRGMIIHKLNANGNIESIHPAKSKGDDIAMDISISLVS